MAGQTFQCTAELIDGQCPVGSQQTVAQTVARIEMKWPTYDEMIDGHTVGFMFFFLPALTMALVAYFVREMRGVID